MPIRLEHQPSYLSLEFLKRGFRFVNMEWPHAARISVPDGGFEERFRESCDVNLPNWSVAPNREMRLGAGLDTASGVQHEVDIVATNGRTVGIAELKNRGGSPGKNDIIVFYAKILDYLLANPDWAHHDITLAFVSRTTFDLRGLATCLGLGIHPIASDLRPLPVLVDNARIMAEELHNGLVISPCILDNFEDLCAQLNRLGLILRETWLDSRIGYLNEGKMTFQAIDPISVDDVAADFRRANSDFMTIIEDFRRAKQQR